MINYADCLPATPTGYGWHLSWLDHAKQNSLVITFHEYGEPVQSRTIAVDLYGTEGVRETCLAMLSRHAAGGVA